MQVQLLAVLQDPFLGQISSTGIFKRLRASEIDQWPR